jgi:hypothetical protein
LETTSNDAPTSEELKEDKTDNSELETEEESVETQETEEDLDPQETDYEAELIKERERLGKKIDKERDKRIAAERSKGLTLEQAEKLIDERIAVMEKRTTRSRAELAADRLSKSPAERDLILHHYDNSIIPTGNIEDDIENAYALANKKKFQGTISELKQSVKSKENRLGGSGAGAPLRQKQPVKISQEIIDAAKFAGVSPEEFVKQTQ